MFRVSLIDFIELVGTPYSWNGHHIVAVPSGGNLLFPFQADSFWFFQHSALFPSAKYRRRRSTLQNSKLLRKATEKASIQKRISKQRNRTVVKWTRRQVDQLGSCFELDSGLSLQIIKPLSQARFAMYAWTLRQECAYCESLEHWTAVYKVQKGAWIISITRFTT